MYLTSKYSIIIDQFRTTLSKQDKIIELHLNIFLLSNCNSLEGKSNTDRNANLESAISVFPLDRQNYHGFTFVMSNFFRSSFTL